MTSASHQDTPPRTTPASERRRVLTIVVAALVVVSIASLFVLPRATRGTSTRDRDAIARTSYAVGVSTGAGFRDVMPVSIDDFRHGLLDGLGDANAHTRALSRPELFAEIRRVMKRLSDAELAQIAARIDADQEY